MICQEGMAGGDRRHSDEMGGTGDSGDLPPFWSLGTITACPAVPSGLMVEVAMGGRCWWQRVVTPAWGTSSCLHLCLW